MGTTANQTQKSRQQWVHDNIVIPAGEAFLVRMREMLQRAEENIADLARVGTASGPASYAEVAAQVQKDLMWGVANVSINNLTSTAYQGDLIRLTPVEEPKQVDPRIPTNSAQSHFVAFADMTDVEQVEHLIYVHNIGDDFTTKDDRVNKIFLAFTRPEREEWHVCDHDEDVQFGGTGVPHDHKGTRRSAAE